LSWLKGLELLLFSFQPQ